MSASAGWGQALSGYPPLQCRCHSRARASLRNRHLGPSIMGSEDEVEQSNGRPCRQLNGRSKRTCELTSSIVPRGTSCHRWVELEFPPVGSELIRLSCCCRSLFPSPAELGAVNPHTVQDHGQPAGQGDDRLFHPAAPGDLHRPSLEPGPFLGTHHGLSCFVEHRPHHLVAAAGYSAVPIDLARLILGARPSYSTLLSESQRAHGFHG